jgi:hypothetical protein
MRVMALLGFIFHMRRGYGYPTLTLFRRLVYLIKGHKLTSALGGHTTGYRRRQSGLAVVNVTYGTNVYMGLGTRKFCLGHN